jgi:DNA-binding NarL/FixJ family response regulator
MEPITVLLVDDNPTFLRIVERFLQSHEGLCVVGTACNSQGALAQARALSPQVILLDLAMPGTNGLETVPQLRRALPDTRIIILTLLDVQGYRSAALSAGADGFVSKSALNLDLVPTIRQLVGAPASDTGASNGQWG